MCAQKTPEVQPTSSPDIALIASRAASLVILSFKKKFHLDYKRSPSLLIPFSAIPPSQEVFFVLRMMQRRMKIGFATMNDSGYLLCTRVPEGCDVSIPRLSDESYALCKAIVFTLSNAHRSMQDQAVVNAIVASNNAIVKELRFLVMMYCTTPNLSVGGGRAEGDGGEEGEGEGEEEEGEGEVAK